MEGRFRLIAGPAELRTLLDVRPLPRSVAWFYLRAVRLAVREDDRVSLESALRPRELARLLEIARGCQRVVEIGTGGGWTAIALVLADPHCRVVSFDPVMPQERERYLALVPASARERIEFRVESSERAQKALDGPVGLVLVEGSGGRQHTLAAFSSARRILRPGGIAVIHGYGGRYVAVRDAMRELGLDGVADGRLFIWREPVEARERRRRGRRVPGGLRVATRIFALALAGVAVGVAGGVLVTSGNETDEPPSVPGLARPAGSTADRAIPKEAGAVGRPARERRAARRGRGRALRTFSGSGSETVGTIELRRRSVLRWKTDGQVFSISSDQLRANFSSSRGSTVLPPGPYRDFKVLTAGDWEIEIKPR